jgi:O-antigen/teichoic acid export membrane protein
MASRLLIAPIGIFGNAVSQVFLNDINDIVRHKEKMLMPRVINTIKWLFVLACCFILPIYFFGHQIILVLLGENWSETTSMLKILSLAVFVRFIVSPISIIMHIVDGQKILSIWQVGYFISTSLLFLIFYKSDIQTVLFYYVIHETFMFLIYLVFILFKTRKFDKINMLSTK